MAVLVTVSAVSSLIVRLVCTGKSGAFRVIYGYFPRYAHVYLFLLYGKNEQGDLTAQEKRQCSQLVREISHLLEERFGPS